ncbi:uncharacterized protein LOC116190187 isoform X2 [Punica granatum]|uniref:Uncharacterized protein LOC116190187 isoform X2 n=1 Tax=Punica granatum TaxID=22663 RepID=A0A6P8C2W6_PUNGR|nr:uncharacterized protein LOC116190187 isoform X2 [Punica granatum]
MINIGRWIHIGTTIPLITNNIIFSFFFSEQGINSTNKGNWANYDEPHCLRTKSYSMFIQEKTIEANGVRPSRAEAYILSHTHGNGNIVNEKAAKLVGQIRSYIGSAGNYETSKDSISQKNDAYSQIKELEKKGRVRCLGKIISSKRSSGLTFESARNNEEVQELRNRISELEGARTTLLPVIQRNFPNEKASDKGSGANKFLAHGHPDSN